MKHHVGCLWCLSSDPLYSYCIKPDPYEINGCDWPDQILVGGKSVWMGTWQNTVSVRANKTQALSSSQTGPFGVPTRYLTNTLRQLYCPTFKQPFKTVTNHGCWPDPLSLPSADHPRDGFGIETQYILNFHLGSGGARLAWLVGGSGHMHFSHFPPYRHLHKLWRPISWNSEKTSTISLLLLLHRPAIHSFCLGFCAWKHFCDHIACTTANTK